MTKKEQKVATDILQVLQANTAVLLVQTLHYHWNLVGVEFRDYHLMFDEQYNSLFADLDLVAERIRAVEGRALGSMKEMIKFANLKEDTGKIPTSKQMVVKLLQHYEDHVFEMKEAVIKLDEILDIGSVNMLEDFIMKYEKTAWMLRSLAGK